MLTLYLTKVTTLLSIKNNAGMAITEVIRGTSKKKLFNELGLESLENRHWYRKL